MIRLEKSQHRHSEPCKWLMAVDHQIDTTHVMLYLYSNAKLFTSTC